MIVKRQIRPKKRPVPKPSVISFRDDYTEEEYQALEPLPHETDLNDIEVTGTYLLPHQLRKKELAIIHGIRENDIFVDPNNGVELYRTSTGTWATSPGY